MPNKWLAVAVVAACAGLSLLPAAPDGPKAGDNLEQTVLGLEKQGWEALKRQDYDALKKDVADDFLAITTEGKRLNRDQLLKELTEIKLKSYSMEQAKVSRLTADAAVVTYRLKAEYTAGGSDLTENAWVSSSWAKRNGKWVTVTYHESLLK